MNRMQYQVLCVETVVPGLLPDVIEFSIQHSGYGAYSIHPPVGSKPRHYHLATHFPAAVDCSTIRTLVNAVDVAGTVEAGRSWPRVVRYLRHLGQADKDRIEDAWVCQFGDWPEGEFSMLLQPDRELAILRDVLARSGGRRGYQVLEELSEAGVSTHRVQTLLSTVARLDQLLSTYQSSNSIL